MDFAECYKNIYMLRLLCYKKRMGKKTPHDIALLSEGEIEIMVYIYWQLVTQDLLTWKDDVPRRAAKMMLADCWTRLKTIAARLKSGEIKAVSYESTQKAVNNIQKFANFEDTVHVSAACMHVVRNCLELFWAELDKEDRARWQLLLKYCGLHSYLCTHTISLMHQRRKEVMQLVKARYAEKTVLHGPLMKSILYASTSANPRDDSGTKSVLSATLIHEIFKVWINRQQKVTKELCITLDNLMYTMCRSFAAHIVMNGLHAYAVDVDQMGGFLSKHMVATNVLESIPIIGSETVITTLRRLIVGPVHTMLPGGGVSGSWKRKWTVSITSEAMKLFMAFLRYIISSAIYGLFNSFDSRAENGRTNLPSP